MLFYYGNGGWGLLEKEEGKMFIIESKLENNVFSGVVIRKGFNRVTNFEMDKLKENFCFKYCLDRKAIEIKTKPVKSVELKEEKEQEQNKPIFEAMSYDELKKYVKDNGLKVQSMKKADILAFLLGE